MVDVVCPGTAFQLPPVTHQRIPAHTAGRMAVLVDTPLCPPLHLHCPNLRRVPQRNYPHHSLTHFAQPSYGGGGTCQSSGG